MPEDLCAHIAPPINVHLLIPDDRGRTLLPWRHDEFVGLGWFEPGPLLVVRDIAGQDTWECHISPLFPCRPLNPRFL